MLRDKALMIEILKALETSPDTFLVDVEIQEVVNVNVQTPYTPLQIRHHVRLLQDIGMIEIDPKNGNRITFAGYDALESDDPIKQMRRWIDLMK